MEVVVREVRDGRTSGGNVDPGIDRAIGLVAVLPDIAVLIGATRGREKGGCSKEQEKQCVGSFHGERDL